MESKKEDDNDVVSGGNGNAQLPTTDTSKNGSISGFESLHRLLQASLSPHLFQEASRLLLGLNCVRTVESIDLPEPAKVLSTVRIGSYF